MSLRLYVSFADLFMLEVLQRAQRGFEDIWIWLSNFRVAHRISIRLSRGPY